MDINNFTENFNKFEYVHRLIRRFLIEINYKICNYQARFFNVKLIMLYSVKQTERSIKAVPIHEFYIVCDKGKII